MASTPAPAVSPIPGTDYAQAAATANAAYQNALAQINNQRQSALQSFGYTGTIDPTTGQLTNMQVDANNPYGQYQQMLAQGADDQRSVLANSMARGLGSVTGARGGGLAAQDLSNARLAFGANSAGLGENLMSTLSGLTGQQQDAQNAMNNALWQAEQDAANNAIQNQAFDTADVSGVTDKAPKGDTVPAAKTYTTDIGPGTAPKNNPSVTAKQSTKAGKGVKFKPAKPANRFNRAVHNRARRGRRR